ncbi:unnamed protein product [Moneuplotes crassus]|uniref:Uncharacterized protein n=1 Tax=Euplotes crassus TaxID=5936 RepID=A0AAD1UD27_EUPCR|nr:unnamed protein product [Moneuplotes crassus]
MKQSHVMARECDIDVRRDTITFIDHENERRLLVKGKIFERKSKTTAWQPIWDYFLSDKRLILKNPIDTR